MRIAMVSILGAVCLVSACGAGDRSAVRTSTVVRTVVAPATASQTSPQPARTSRPAVPTSRGSHTSPVISVPGGDEVLTWGPPDRVTVWRWQQGAAAWQPQSSLDTSATGNETLTATGDVVSGSSDATFVIAGPFGGGGGVGYVGVTRSAAGWGVLSSADPPATRLTVAVGGRVTSGVQAMGFGTGELATDVPNSFFPLSDQDEYPLETFWRFTGSAFVRDRTTQFRAEDAADPDDGAVELPVSCPELPADGRYFVAGVDLARRPSVVGAGQGIHAELPDHRLRRRSVRGHGQR